MRPGGRLGPLAERQFRLLFAGRTISLLGSAFAPVALAFAVLDDLDGTPSQLGLLLGSIWAPQIVLTLLGGVWADRLPRNLVMVATDLTMFGTQAAVAALLLTQTAELWHLIALQVVRGAANAFFFPASTGLVPLVVGRAHLQPANALLKLTQGGTTLIGAGTAGVVVAAAGAGWALAFDAATFLVSAILLVRIRLPRGERVPGSNVLRELREGWAEFRSRRWLWTVAAGSAVGNIALAAGVMVLGPVTADREFGGAAAWGAIVAGDAAGLVVGGLVALRFAPRRPLLVGCAVLLLSPPLLALLAVAAPVPLVVVAAFASGFGIDLFNVLWETTLQRQVPEALLSRVSAYDALGSFLFIPVGLTIAGPLADAIGRAEALWALCALDVTVVLAMLAVADVRRLEGQLGAAIAAS
jgi:MFS family permease